MNASLTELMADLYERTKTPEEMSTDLCRFAKEYLAKPERVHVRSAGPVSTRRRIGLMSPQFCCSPVYFFGIGALRLLAQEVDLVVLNRGLRSDWASSEFKSIAREWHETAGLDRERLAEFIARQGLDVLIDMGGWMDPVGLSAISTKPAGRIYKWVGGQAATTGIRAFDGFFTDRYQSSPQDQHLYAEPLVFLDHGYVSYTPPAYMPDPVATDENDVFGVIANPVKISSAFLAFLKDAVDRHAGEAGGIVCLRFIDRRYRHARLRSRITSALEASQAYKQKRLQLEFIVPQSHRDYLEQVAKLTAVIDTFPYSGGLTTIEALALGVPCFTRAGSLFSERHSYSHCMYAGMEVGQSEIGKNLPDLLHFCHRGGSAGYTRSSLIRKTSDRLNHHALADEIAQHLHTRLYSCS
jgi:predicted O-linked N-acetylglucosamine transferase (SPINDLY family)